MIILGIETSCDETAAAIVEGKNNQSRVKLLSNVIASSIDIQAKYGGVVPEQAARQQLKTIIPVIKGALQEARCKPKSIDAIAVTCGPGLIGSLLVGVETAKTLSLVWNKPLISVNHLLAHFYASWLTDRIPLFPYIGLLASGGHTDLLLFKNHNQYQYLGGTRDDAAGECFDKCARLLGLSYPGGAQLAQLAEKGDSTAFEIPRPMIGSKNFDFSFSGLKTAVSNLISSQPGLLLESGSQRANLAAAIEAAIVEVLITKTLSAIQTYQVNQIILAGGVAANQKLRQQFKLILKSCQLKINFSVPPLNLCTDNAAMIATCAFYNFKPINPLLLQANPNLSLA